MPTYEKECNECLKEFEVTCKYEDSKNVKCPHCGGLDIKHLISAPSGFEFNGEGFYETEHGKQQHRK